MKHAATLINQVVNDPGQAAMMSFDVRDDWGRLLVWRTAWNVLATHGRYEPGRPQAFVCIDSYHASEDGQPITQLWVSTSHFFHLGRCHSVMGLKPEPVMIAEGPLGVIGALRNGKPAVSVGTP